VDAKRNRRPDTTFNIAITRTVRPLINTSPLLTLRASQAKTIAGGRPSINLILGRLSTAVLMGGTLQYVYKR
jgi:hypothetical protein